MLPATTGTPATSIVGSSMANAVPTAVAAPRPRTTITCAMSGVTASAPVRLRPAPKWRARRAML